MSIKRRVLVFGGGFSPPTLAHEAIIEACLRMKQFDEVWLMPSGDRLDKTIASADDVRLRMLEIVRDERFNASPRLKVSDFELLLPRPSQSSLTLKVLTKRYPDTEFWFAFGRDSYLSMPDWPGGSELREELKMVVFCSGPGAAISGDNVLVADLGKEYSDVSSTKVREALKNRRSIGGLVSGPVARFLRNL